MKRRSAFTLIELIIILAVIGAMLSTLTPIALNAVRKAQASRIAQDLYAIKKAVEEYTLIHNPMTPASHIRDLRDCLSGRFNEDHYGIQRVLETSDDEQVFKYFVYYQGDADYLVQEMVEHFTIIEAGPPGRFGVITTLPRMW